jgi:hypothetical protein
MNPKKPIIKLIWFDINKSINSDLILLCQGTAQRVLMFLATTILFMPSTLAKSLDEYCVSQIGQTASRLSLIKV